MDESIVVVATVGFGAGAGLAVAISQAAPTVMRWVKLYAIAGVVFTPFALGIVGVQQLMNAGWSKSDFDGRVWAYFFIPALPLGALCVSMTEGLGRRFIGLVAGVLVVMPIYLAFTVSLLAANVTAHVL